jgi:hypothetical protein
LKARSEFARLAAAATLAAVLCVNLQGGAEAEDQLKSATLLAFVQNARWAEQLAANTPLTVGVVGRPAFLRWLQSSMEGKLVNGHPIRILEIAGPIDSRCCQVLYFATDKSADIKSGLQLIGSAHALTIGETDGFLAQGGAVNLFLLDGHMAFEVSLGALAHAGVEISSKLLRFGQIRDLPKARPAP